MSLPPSTTTSVTVRMDEVLRDRLARAAAIAGRSLTAEINFRLDDSLVRMSDTYVSGLLDALDMPRFIRVRGGSTEHDLQRVTTICQRLEVTDLVLAATPNDMNGAVLVAVIQTPRVICVMDGSWANMAREPRINEVARFFQRLDRLGVLDNARWCTQLVPATTDLTAEDAANTILREGSPAPMDVRSYLKLLSVHGLFELEDFRAERLELGGTGKLTQ